MDQRGTSELEGAPGAPGGMEEQAQGEQTQGEAVQFDLFGLPVQAAPAAAPEPNTDAPKKRRAREILAAPPSQDVLALAAQLPPQIHLGTSTWSFPGWNGIVYGDEYSNSKLSRDGLTAYGAHPLLKTVSIDRSFYQALTVTDYLRYAQQVPDDFRFIVKAPMTITDATVRAERGEPVSLNPCFLNAQMAIDDFVTPCLEGLGAKAGALVFQLPPLPDQMLAQPAVFLERLAAFLTALPKLPEGTCYAIEIRDASLLTPRFIRTLKAAGVRYCVGIHARMPDPLRQAAALALLDGEPAGPLIVRWSLHGGFKYEQAKAKYEPFDKLVDEDPATRASLAELAARYALAGQPVVIAVNNKAEGSAPLSCIELAREIVEACVRLTQEQERENEQDAESGQEPENDQTPESGQEPHPPA
ncbi:DUF72 domain-containing protein [bacterium M00.F.Ca.ET.228.01.1.1]|uniref:DUF72 domain-containing protein n=1 Tax=Paraburkholderia phenoliruptrix TaxID=252970 RepID=UPI001092DA73|nr:DUF72 domain-containing protein [Paraburkholderia phenoliruptrix]TGP44043.1 DUF72 domain-containing protein [bacterium M00.F.Ca.ET.228.01.1.1]TGS01706.1 DUF72 domain-containing protein [bacterium M00.F.Ca.ET.191.01.1.1]TGU08689.1 DUF72 domain-containing protein [bacterium M00.F.Ca.ET.155.01.1.1]MBW0450326.1 DUF72 domain-containing protein [Paraburkholderia phenoliruptrix]MBW9097287.1 DUF72 domain-containing protein [Paraburkholderia phenoliruptrix]